MLQLKPVKIFYHTLTSKKRPNQDKFQGVYIMNKMGKLYKKKIILILAVVLLLAVLIAAGIMLVRSDKPDEPSLEEIVSDKLSAYQTDIADSLETLTTNEKVADYLMAWAANKSINASRDNAGNVVFSLKASSKEIKELKLKPVVIACEYDASDMSSYIEPLATALTVAKNAENHSAFKIIFMPCENAVMTGASALSETYLSDNTELFFLGKSSSSKVSLTSGGFEEFSISDKLSRTSPTYDKAYRITMEGAASQPLTIRQQSLPNPIKQLGSLLANFKSTSFLFELSSFSGGSNAVLTPSKASVTLVINSADEEKFISKMDKAIEKFNEKYQDAFPDISYTYEEVDVPEKVLTKKESENIISLLYTAPSGVYYKDDDGNILAVTNIGKISTKNSKLSIKACIMSCSADILDELHDSYQTIAGLCNVKIQSVNEYGIFSGGGASAALLSSFEEAFISYTDDSKMVIEDAFETTACNVFCEKNSSMAMLYCGISDKTKEKFAGSLITYLDKTSLLN